MEQNKYNLYFFIYKNCFYLKKKICLWIHCSTGHVKAITLGGIYVINVRSTQHARKNVWKIWHAPFSCTCQKWLLFFWNVSIILRVQFRCKSSLVGFFRSELFLVSCSQTLIPALVCVGSAPWLPRIHGSWQCVTPWHSSASSILTVQHQGGWANRGNLHTDFLLE